MPYGSAREDVWSYWPDGRPLCWPTPQRLNIRWIMLAAVGIGAFQVAVSGAIVTLYRLFGRPRYFDPYPPGFPGWLTVWARSAARSACTCWALPGAGWLIWLAFSRMVAPTYDSYSQHYLQGSYRFVVPSIDLNPTSAAGVAGGVMLLAASLVANATRAYLLSLAFGSPIASRLCPACSYPAPTDSIRCSECGMHHQGLVFPVLSLGARGAVRRAKGLRRRRDIAVSLVVVVLLTSPVSIPASLYFQPSRTVSTWGNRVLRWFDDQIVRTFGAKKPPVWTRPGGSMSPPRWTEAKAPIMG